MGFAYKSINTKAPSMSAYSGNVVDFNYQDTKVEDAKLINLNPEEIENIDLNIPVDLDPIIDVVTGTSATITVFALSLVEGIANLGEALVDTGVTVGTAVLTPFTWAADKINGLTGVETHYTEDMWDSTKAFVSEDLVKDAFDNYYNNNPGGQRLKEEAFAFDTVRSVGNEVGYVSGIVGLTILTGGVGTAGLGSTSGALSMSQGMGLFAGLGGFGKGADNAWSQGASTARGLFSATANGLWEGFQYYLGGRIAGFSVSVTKWFNAILRMGLDALLGGTEGIVRPAINSIISGDSYMEEFRTNGGLYTVAINTIFSFAFSGLGEFKLRDYIQFGGFKSKIKGKINPGERKQLIDEFLQLFVPNGSDHKATIDFYAEFFMNTDNPEALKVLSTMIEYKKKAGFNLTTTKDGFARSFFSVGESRINISKHSCTNKLFGSGMHESGHFLHCFKRNNEIPLGMEDVFDRARIFNSKKGASTTYDFYIDASKKMNEAKEKAVEHFNNYLNSLGFTEESYFNKLFSENENMLLNMVNSDFIELYLREINISENLIKKLGPITPDRITYDLIYTITTNQMYALKINATDLYFSKVASDYSALSDILSALYKRQDVSLNGYDLKLTHVHETEYYMERPFDAPFREMIANYTQLKTTGSERSIRMLRQMVGDELVDVLDNFYQSFFK